VKDHAHVTGPYVDYACTNQHTFTLSVHVYHDDRPLEVAAMDIPIDQLERRIMPALCAETAPCALLNATAGYRRQRGRARTRRSTSPDDTARPTPHASTCRSDCAP
jgi:hypothetical protein